MSIVKIGWSGGKDSTCAVMKHLERGDQVKIVTYIPMFTENIPLLTKKHYKFITDTADYFRSLGAEVTIVTGITYYQYVTKRSTRGKYKGRLFGFPLFVRQLCGFKRDSKEKALKSVDVGYYDYESVGICFDEKARQSQLNDNLRSILCELEITQKDTKNFCVTRKLLSPHYKYNKRDGCALCPHASDVERLEWFYDYPIAVPLVIELQSLVKKERPGMTPLRNYRWFIED